ncbi:MAG: DUF3604 domain-containing protein, partial [Clostridium sp.]
MPKRLKFFNEIKIMHNGMECIRKDNGNVAVVPALATVGAAISFQILYTVGEQRIEPNGVIRFTIPFGCTNPQIAMPLHPGYTTVNTTALGVTVTPFVVENDWSKRGPDRTKAENVSEHVGTHIWVRITGRALEQGEQVTLVYGDTSYNRQAAAIVCPTAGPIQFDVATDRQGRMEAPYSGYYRINNPGICLVEPMEAEKFEVIIPSETECGVPFEITVFVVDRLHNLVVNHKSAFRCSIGKKQVYEGEFGEDDCGIKKIFLTVLNEDTVFVKVDGVNTTLTGESNPSIVKKHPCTMKHFWGDMHGHTGIQWGRGSGRSYYEYARQVASVDFCSLTDPDAGRYTNNNETARNSLSCYMTDEQWKEIQDINKEYYEVGKFVPILGYEYHNDAPDPEFGGDRNVYYEFYDEPIRRCVDEGSYCPAMLWEQLKKEKIRAITVPHHTAKRAMLGSWEINDDEINRLAEIYSSWGNSEGAGCERPIIGGAVYENHSVQYALSKGYRLGFITGSDTHAGTPGYSHWVFAQAMESYRGGLTCIMTEKLDKKSIFDALYNRNVYATTGERIILEFDLNGVRMGQELSLAQNPIRHLHVKVVGTD